MAETAAIATAAAAVETAAAGSGGGNGSNGGSGNRAEEPSPITWTSGRGYVHNTRGVITGEGAGYAHWVQDDRGWKLVYPNGSFVTGAMMVQEDQSTVEQVAWELVNGSWYAFGADGYIKSGWVFDYQLGRWYNMSIDRGMQTGWYTDPPGPVYLLYGTGRTAGHRLEADRKQLVLFLMQ